MFTSSEKIIVQVNYMTCLVVDKISLTDNSHMIMHKDVSYLVNKFTHNTSMVVSLFLWRELRLITLTNLNHSPCLWHNFILIYMMKVMVMLSLPRHIFVFFFNFLRKNKWYLNSWQSYGITRIVAHSSIIVYQLFIYYRVLLYNVLLLLKDQ